MQVKNLLKQELAPLTENLEGLKAKPSEIEDNVSFTSEKYDSLLNQLTYVNEKICHYT